jgi:hypothetical protein
MPDYAETRAMLLRWSLGIEKKIAGGRELARLVDWSGGLVEVVRTRGTVGGHTRREDGGSVVTVPILGDELAEAVILAHELGHVFCDPLPGETPETDEEEAAWSFAHAFLLPRSLVRAAVRDSTDAVASLASTSGLEPTALCELYDWHLLHLPPVLHAPQPWAAVHHFRGKMRKTHWHAAFKIDGPDHEWYEWHCRDKAACEAMRLTVTQSLHALRLHEWRIQNRGALLQTEAVPLSLPHLALAA